MIVSVFVRRLREGATFADFIAEWEADRGFGVPTRVFNSVSLDDPRDILTVGFVDISVEELRAFFAQESDVKKAESVRHERIETVIESTTLKQMYELKTEHDFTAEPRSIELGSDQSLIAQLVVG